jgi:hypothetical protein
MEGKCTIYFEDPFWVGIFEREDENGYAAARQVFGAEPGDAELLQWIFSEYSHLSYSRARPQAAAGAKEVGFKRRQRELRQEMETSGVGTRAQRAVQAEYERRKQERQAETREQREERERQEYSRRRERKKEKRR